MQNDIHQISEPAMNFTTEAKLACIERELSLRKRVYPRQIMTHRLTEKKAAYELAVMEAIAKDYREQQKRETLQFTSMDDE